MLAYASCRVLAAVVGDVPVYSEASGRATGPVTLTLELYMARRGKAKIASVSKRPGIHVTGHRGDTHDGTTSKRCGKAPPLRAAALDGGELLHRSTTRFPVRRGRHRLLTLLLLRKGIVWPRPPNLIAIESRKPLFCNPEASAVRLRRCGPSGTWVGELARWPWRGKGVGWGGHCC